MAKRFTKPSINWTNFAKIVGEEEKANFLGFKGKSEAYLRRVQANPESPPKIEWEEYKKRVPVEGLVDKLRAAYEAFRVPYPADTLSPAVDQQWAALQPEIKDFCDQRQKEIDEATKQLNRINALPDFEVITMEMVCDLYPDIALDPVRRPTFWPHSADEQEPRDTDAPPARH